MEFLPLIGIALLFWLFIIRPQSRRQKELRNMQSALSVGDEIMLTSGMFARVQEIADDHLVVEIADGVAIKIAKGAVSSKVRPDDPYDEQDEQDELTEPLEERTEERPDDNDEPGTGTSRPQES